MDRDGLLALYAYNAYANRLVMDAASRLSQADLHREASPSHGSVFNLLRHLLVAEAFFLADCQGSELQPVELDTLADLRRFWEQTSQAAQAFISGLSSEDLARVITVKMREHAFHFPIWQLLTQAMVHSTHHRGELSILMSGLGQPLPTLDIILQFAEQSGQPWPWKG